MRSRRKRILQQKIPLKIKATRRAWMQLELSLDWHRLCDQRGWHNLRNDARQCKCPRHIATNAKPSRNFTPWTVNIVRNCCKKVLLICQAHNGKTMCWATHWAIIRYVSDENQWFATKYLCKCLLVFIKFNSAFHWLHQLIGKEWPRICKFHFYWTVHCNNNKKQQMLASAVPSNAIDAIYLVDIFCTMVQI